jgi:hypothetical protein
MHVILTIDGKEVYNNNNPNNKTSEVVTETQYVPVTLPKEGQTYFYISDRDDDGKPIYSQGTISTEWMGINDPRNDPYKVYNITKIGTADKERILPENILKVKTKGGKKSRRKLRRPRKSKKSN